MSTKYSNEEKKKHAFIYILVNHFKLAKSSKYDKGDDKYCLMNKNI